MLNKELDRQGYAYVPSGYREQGEFLSNIPDSDIKTSLINDRNVITAKFATRSLKVKRSILTCLQFYNKNKRAMISSENNIYDC